MYMAPETDLGEPQSHKSDVWVLYVTMLWTLNVENIRGIVESQGPFTEPAMRILLPSGWRKTRGRRCWGTWLGFIAPSGPRRGTCCGTSFHEESVLDVCI